MYKNLLLVFLLVLISCDANKNDGNIIPGFKGESILIVSGSSSEMPVLKKADHTKSLKLHDFMALSGQNSFLGTWDVVQLVENLKISYSDKSVELTVYGHTNKGQSAWGYQLLAGNFFTEADLEMKTDVIILGENVARELFGDELPMGKKVLLADMPYQVTGIAVDGEKNLFGDNPGDIVMIPISNFLRKISRSSHLRAGKLELLNDDEMDSKLELLRASLRDRHHLKADEGDDFTFQIFSSR